MTLGAKTILFAAAFSVGLSGCAMLGIGGASSDRSRGEQPVADVTDGATIFTGSLTYMSRIALPPDSVAIVALTAEDADPASGALAEKRINLQGVQPPIPFSLEAPAGTMRKSGRYLWQAAIWSGDKPRWASRQIPVTADSGTQALGEVILEPFVARAFATEFRCGADIVTISAGPTAMMMSALGKDYVLKPSGSASGAKYEADGDSATTFWSKGDRALVSVAGTSLTECTMVNKAAETLSGPEWLVEDIAGERVVDGSRVTITFHEDGRLSGKASCNSYNAPYKLDGSSMTIGNAASTMMACTPPLLDQEHRFLETLRAVTGFTFDKTGALLLSTAAGERIIARKS